MKKLLLVGAGGHSKSVIDVIENKNEWKIEGLVGRNLEVGKKLLGYQVIATDDDLEKLRREFIYAFIAIGQIKTSDPRRLVAEKLEYLSYKLPNIISPFSVRSQRSSIGFGNFIGHGVIINNSVDIKNHCIVNSKALLEHDVIVNSFCHISTGVILNGGVEIGEGSFIGSGTIVREGIKIPPHSIISAGSRIMGWP